MSIKVSGGGGGGGPSPGVTDAISLEYSDWQSLSTGVLANALFDTVDAGTAALWDAGTPDTIHPTAGIWLVHLILQFQNANSTAPVTAAINSSEVSGQGTTPSLVPVGGTVLAQWLLMYNAPGTLKIGLTSAANQSVSAVMNAVKLAGSWRA